MDDYAVYLAEEAKSDIVALHQFRILYTDEEDAFHFFFEGDEDSLFFMPEARRHTGSRLTHIYICGGKCNVVAARDAIREDGYNLETCLFFVDRDFDDFLGTQAEIDDYTYITDNYSIESDLSSMEAARVLLEDVVRLSRADPEFNRVERALASALEEFYLAVQPLMAWILAAKECGCSPNLRNTVGLKGIVEMPDMRPKITKKGLSEFKRKVVVNGRMPPASVVLKWLRVIKPISCKLWTRGKYDIWFFQVALIAVLEQTNERRKTAGARTLRIPRSLRDGQIFELLGGRVAPPESLQAYYEARLR